MQLSELNSFAVLPGPRPSCESRHDRVQGLVYGVLCGTASLGTDGNDTLDAGQPCRIILRVVISPTARVGATEATAPQLLAAMNNELIPDR